MLVFLSNDFKKNGRAALLQSAQALGIAAQPGLNTNKKDMTWMSQEVSKWLVNGL